MRVTNPGRVEPLFGNPYISEIETTYIERFNGTLRGWLCRLTRKTYACSKDWDMVEAALALLFASYSFCKAPGTLRKTPAMAVGLTDHRWSMDELLETACLVAASPSWYTATVWSSGARVSGLLPNTTADVPAEG